MTARHGPAFSGDKAHDARANTILSIREQPALNSEQAHDDALGHHRVLAQAPALTQIQEQLAVHRSGSASPFVRQGPDCASLGLTCESGRCVGRGPACSSDAFREFETVHLEGISCSGGSLEACVGGHEAVFDCITLGPGVTCQSVGYAHFRGLGNECVPADNNSASSTTPGTCAGTVFSYCNAGRIEHIDCTTLDFTGCKVDPRNARYGCI